MEVFERIISQILEPAVRVLFAAGFFLFLWGLAKFLYNLESVAKNSGDRNRRKEGLQHLIWGLVGMLVMVSVQGIIALIINTFGLNPGQTNFQQQKIIDQTSPFERSFE